MVGNQSRRKTVILTAVDVADVYTTIPNKAIRLYYANIPSGEDLLDNQHSKS